MFKQNIIGNTVFRLRTEKNYTIAKLSKEIGFSSGHLSEIESGKSLPSLQKLWIICDFFDVSVSDFFKTATSETSPEVEKLISLAVKLSPEQLEKLIDLIETIV